MTRVNGSSPRDTSVDSLSELPRPARPALTYRELMPSLLEVTAHPETPEAIRAKLSGALRKTPTTQNSFKLSLIANQLYWLDVTDDVQTRLALAQQGRVLKISPREPAIR